MPVVRVRIVPEDRVETVELPRGARVSDLLEKLGLGRESHVVLVNGAPVPEDDPLPLEGEVVVVRVLSGG